jgi:hypothetical protein
MSLFAKDFCATPVTYASLTQFQLSSKENQTPVRVCRPLVIPTEKHARNSIISTPDRSLAFGASSGALGRPRELRVALVVVVAVVLLALVVTGRRRDGLALPLALALGLGCNHRALLVNLRFYRTRAHLLLVIDPHVFDLA